MARTAARAKARTVLEKYMLELTLAGWVVGLEWVWEREL